MDIPFKSNGVELLPYQKHSQNSACSIRCGERKPVGINGTINTKSSGQWMVEKGYAAQKRWQQVQPVIQLVLLSLITSRS